MINQPKFTQENLSKFIDEIIKAVGEKDDLFITMAKRPRLLNMDYKEELRTYLKDNLYSIYKKIFVEIKPNENKKYRIVTNGRYFKIQRKAVHNKWVDLKDSNFIGCNEKRDSTMFSHAVVFLNEYSAINALKWIIVEDEYEKNKYNWVELKF